MCPGLMTALVCSFFMTLKHMHCECLSLASNFVFSNLSSGFGRIICLKRKGPPSILIAYVGPHGSPVGILFQSLISSLGVCLDGTIWIRKIDTIRCGTPSTLLLIDADSDSNWETWEIELSAHATESTSCTTFLNLHKYCVIVDGTTHFEQHKHDAIWGSLTCPFQWTYKAVRGTSVKFHLTPCRCCKWQKNEWQNTGNHIVWWQASKHFILEEACGICRTAW